MPLIIPDGHCGAICDRVLPDPPPSDGVGDERDEDDGAERGAHRDRDHVGSRLQRLRRRRRRVDGGCEGCSM